MVKDPTLLNLGISEGVRGPLALPTLVPNEVKVAVKMYRLLSCLYKKLESILAFLMLFYLIRLDTFVI